MGVLRLFKKGLSWGRSSETSARKSTQKKAEEAAKKLPAENNTTEATELTPVAQKENHSESTSKGKSQEMAPADLGTAARSIQVVKKYSTAFLANDMEEVKKHCEERCFIRFLDSAVEMPLSQYIEIWQATLESFPDFTLEMDLDNFKPEECRTVGSRHGKESTTVYARNVRAKGTHTGAPYAFGPFPAIEAKGIFVCDKVTNTNVFFVRDNKIHRVEVKTDGSSDESGPAYFYQSIGGFLF